jgi:hypothetical protein
VSGVAAGILGALAMNMFARAVNTANHGREADGAAAGGHRTGRGVQPPQSDDTADEDATVRVGTLAYRTVTGSEPAGAARLQLGSAAHYGFSVTAAVCYMWLADRVPAVRAGFGTLYGTLVWGVADEGIVPALGLSRGPRELPAGVHMYALSGHWVYGATLEAVRRVVADD